MKRVDRWLGRLPRWARAGLGALALLLGVAIVARPTTSLGVLALLIGAGFVASGLLELTEPPSWQRNLSAALWIVAGLFVLASPDLTVTLLAAIVAAGLVVRGGLRVAGAWRARPLDARVAALALGGAEVAFGVLAFAWPDITLLIVAVVFGARLVLFGAAELWNALRAPDRPRATTTPGALRRWARTVAALVAVLLAAGALAASAAIRDRTPVVDAFYAAPRDVPDAPGRLLRAEPFTRAIPSAARAWRILYTTTRGDGDAAVASGLVVVPRNGDGSWPVIDWTHGTTGYAEDCAPSLADQPFESGAFFLLDQVIDRGWALVATDYIGLGTAGPHPYLIGPDSGHAALDAVRAARELGDARLGAQTVVWGHSQGGGAALWTGAIAQRYAPDIALSGVAALAPAGNLTGLVANLPNVTGGSVFAAFVAAAYSAIYDDVRFSDYIRPGATVTVREMAKRCLAPPGILPSVLAVLALARDPNILARDPTTGAFGRRLEQNIPPATGDMPLLLGQGGADQLVIPSAQDAYVKRLCAAGRQVDYRVYPGRDHVPLVQPDSRLVPELLAWTEDRLRERAPTRGCNG